MDPNIIDYYIINWAIPLIITIENRHQIDFGKPAEKVNTMIIFVVVFIYIIYYTFSPLQS